MGKFEEGISRRIFRIQDPLEKLRTYFSAWTEMFEGDYLEYLEIVLDFWAEGVRKRNNSCMIDLNKLYLENRDILDNLLSECIKKKEIKKVDTKLTASIMLGALDGILLQWIMDRKAFNKKDAALLFADTMIKGLKVTRAPGKKEYPEKIK